MGLDMWLYCDIDTDGLDLTGLLKDIKPEDTTSIRVEIAYWRKANAIHDWFANLSDHGYENCADLRVSIEQLEELLMLVDEVLEASNLVEGEIQNGSRFNKETNEWEPILVEGKKIENPVIAEELLPTTDGFFFGSTAYDEGYIQDLIYTKEVLEKVIKEHGPNKSYIYSAWW